MLPQGFSPVRHFRQQDLQRIQVSTEEPGGSVIRNAASPPAGQNAASVPAGVGGSAY